MLNVIKGKNIIPTDKLKINTTYQRVVIDLGCGDGKETYKQASIHTKNFYIGIDANFAGLEEISHKSDRKPAKGGLENIIFIHSAAEQLPDELNEIADEVQVNFPWGSLLKGVILAEDDFMNNITKVSKDRAVLEIITTYDDKFEERFRKDSNLPELTFEYINKNLRNNYRKFGITIEKIQELNEEEKQQIQSSWGKQILSKRSRKVFYIKCRVIKYGEKKTPL